MGGKGKLKMNPVYPLAEFSGGARSAPDNQG